MYVISARTHRDRIGIKHIASILNAAPPNPHTHTHPQPPSCLLNPISSAPFLYCHPLYTDNSMRTLYLIDLSFSLFPGCYLHMSDHTRCCKDGILGSASSIGETSRSSEQCSLPPEQSCIKDVLNITGTLTSWAWDSNLERNVSSSHLVSPATVCNDCGNTYDFARSHILQSVTAICTAISIF